jgi:3-hydroxyisobutyrate dehydrogenase-like beta-hydroxyacid dehydrogenase
MKNEVSVIGLGMMGSALARLLLRNGYRVTIWNRTSAKAEPLVREGAVLAPSAASAVGASPIVVVCVHDYKAINQILGAKEISSAPRSSLVKVLREGDQAGARAAASQRG